MRTLAIAAIFATFVLAAVALADPSASTSVVSITLPLNDAKQFGPGPGQALAKANCTVCHAADYVYMQPPLTQSSGLLR